MSARSASKESYPNELGRPRLKPVITNVVPVERWAILVRHDPKLTPDLPEQVEAAIKAVWDVWKEELRAAVAKIAQLDIDDIEVDPDEVVRLRYDGKTPMIDLPRLRSRAGCAFEFDLRFCVALCLHEFSSKIWTRVGPLNRRRGYPADELSEVFRRYRSFASVCGAWFQEQLIRFTANLFAGRNWNNEGVLEVTMLGVQIDGYFDEEDLNEWLFAEGSNPNLENDDLRRFLKEAAPLDYDIRELESRGAFWMSLPTSVELKNRDLVSRTALFLVRAIGDVVQVVGIGLDDSANGAFASDIALKVSRWVASRI
jgi:hypothetical protein